MTTFNVENMAAGYTAPPETFYLAYRGSIAHGMYVPATEKLGIDDVDLMGFVFGGIEHYFGLHEWGSRGTKEFKQGHYDVVLYEIRKAFSLLLQGNPNILSMLWVGARYRLIEGEAAHRLIESRHLFVGKHAYNAFAGYAHAQMSKMETRDPEELREYIGVTNELKRRGEHPNHKGEEIAPPEDHPLHFANWSSEKLRIRLASYLRKGENVGYMGDKRKQLVLQHGYDSKNAAHLIRLLRMCIEFLKTGELIVDRPDASELLKIKRGEWELDAVKSLAADLFAEAKSARDASTLPAEPDRAGAEALLISLIRDYFRFRDGA